MSSKEELEKLTVAQLKEKLKSRKLAISGAKTDLINRLHESIMTEEKLLEEGPGGESIDLSNVNMDEVLGVLDDEKDSAASSDLLGDKSTSELLRQSDERLSLSIGTDGGKGTSQQQSPVKNSEKNAVSASQSGSSTTSNNQNNAAVTGAGDAEKKQLPMDEAKKVQLKTAARLGVPLAGAVGGDAETKGVAAKKRVGNEEELKAKRATRFGIVDETKRKSATEEDDKMLKRAERFGLPLKRGAASMESSTTAAAGDDDALQKRAKRFGMMISANGGEQDEKKAARAKRFGGSVAAT